ncbi:MAG: hypothetical protein QM770_13615 [Tepidisphaeraceae bacterium]
MRCSSHAAFEGLESRRLLASIDGVLTEVDYARDLEAVFPLAPGVGRTIYVDLDHDGVRDAEDPACVSDAVGRYSIGGLMAGQTYWLRADLPAGLTTGFDWNPVIAKDVGTSINLYIEPTGENLGGFPFIDINNDGRFTQDLDTAVPQGKAFRVWNDVNADGRLDAGEALARPDLVYPFILQRGVHMQLPAGAVTLSVDYGIAVQTLNVVWPKRGVDASALQNPLMIRVPTTSTVAGYAIIDKNRNGVGDAVDRPRVGRACSPTTTTTASATSANPTRSPRRTAGTN